MKRFFIIVFLVFIFHSIDAEAANIMVRPSADCTYDGDGTTWACAAGAGQTGVRKGIPASFTRGDIYYIADGSYGSYTFDDAVSGTTVITIKKAVAADHGTDTGWSDSYGDGEAAFTTWSFSTGYYDINGQTGGGPDSWDSGFGFKVSSTRGKRIILDANTSNITIRHTEVRNTVNTATGNGADYGSLVYAYANVTYITFSYCKIHYTYGCMIQTGFGGPDNWTVEYSKLGDNTGDSYYHSEIWSTMGNDNITLRYNWFFAWRSTGGLIAINGDGTYNDIGVCEDWLIYGNVFEQAGTTASWIIAAIDDASNTQVARRWKIYNNTFINVNSTSTWVNAPALSTYGEANNEFKNNVFYGNTDGVVIGGVTEDYNSYQGSGQFFTGSNDELLTSSPFIDYGAGNYQLQAQLPGYALASPYNIDMLGNTRGGDDIWDRGAYEYVAGPSVPDNTPPTVSITLPTSGSIVSDTISVSANASDNVAVAGVQFKLDGANLGSEDTTKPYSVSWSTATASNGTHTLAATARDTSGNIATSASITVTVSNSSPPPPTSSNLLASYNFDENSGITIFDRTGNSNAGTASGISRTAAGKYTRAVDLDGATSYVDVPNSSTINITGNAITVEAWVNPDVLGTNMIVSKPVSSSNHTSPYFSYSLHTHPTGTPRFCITTNGKLSCVSSSQMLSANTWQHIAGVYDGTSLIIHVNGIVRGTLAASGSITGYPTPLRLGANGGFGENFDGKIDDVRIYSRALTQSEIQTDMNTPVIPPVTIGPSLPPGLSVQ